MKKHDVGKYVREHSGKYLLVNSLARRVRELQSGHKPLIPHGSQNPVDTAIKEFAEDKIAVTTLNTVVGGEEGERTENPDDAPQGE